MQPVTSGNKEKELVSHNYEMKSSTYELLRHNYENKVADFLQSLGIT